MTRKELLNELRAIQLDLFRNAASLDKMISDAESILGENNDEVYLSIYCRMLASHREDLIRVCGYDKLWEREQVIWRNLIKKREES